MEKDSWSKFKSIMSKIIIGVIAVSSITSMIFSICTFCKISKGPMPCPGNFCGMCANDMQNRRPNFAQREQNSMQKPSENGQNENEVPAQQEQQAESQVQSAQ